MLDLERMMDMAAQDEFQTGGAIKDSEQSFGLLKD